ncbi:MAG: hypothetical protein WEB87_02475 [Bacteriovoracaceae bacterium]
MELLIFAHRGEAQEFIKHFSFKAQDSRNRLYMADDLLLLITGEGIYEVFSQLGFVLGKYPVKKVINMGIAGSLDPKLDLDQIVSIRTVYCETGELQFQSFTLGDERACLDAITASQRVLGSETAQKLAAFAPIVDRELWAAAKTCFQFKIPLLSFKLLSDYAGASTNCFDLKQKALKFSAALLERYLGLNETNEKNEEEEEDIKIPMQMSFTQRAKYKKNMQALRRSPSFCENSFLKGAKEVLTNEGLSPKQLANALLEQMELELNPIKQKTKLSFEKLSRPAKDAGANILFDKNFEKRKFVLQMEVNHQKNLDNLRQCLESLSFEQFEKVWNGNLDV